MNQKKFEDNHAQMYECYDIKKSGDCVEDDNYNDCYQKDDILESKEEEETATASFECAGTSSRRHTHIKRVNTRDSHLVDASIANPVQFIRKRSHVESRTLFSCDRSWQDDWIKCISCSESDTLFDNEVSVLYKQEMKDLYEDEKKFEQYKKKRRNEEMKNKKSEKKIKSEEFIKKSKV
jgi:hypothetical protein